MTRNTFSSMEKIFLFSFFLYSNQRIAAKVTPPSPTHHRVSKSTNTNREPKETKKKTKKAKQKRGLLGEELSNGAGPLTLELGEARHELGQEGRVAVQEDRLQLPQLLQLRRHLAGRSCRLEQPDRALAPTRRRHRRHRRRIETLGFFDWWIGLARRDRRE